MGINIVLGDQDIGVSIKRLNNALSDTSLSSLWRFTWEIVMANKSLLSSSTAEPLWTRDGARITREIYEKYLPLIARVIIHERDLFLINALREIPASKKKVVGIVGAGHLDGIVEYWETYAKRQDELRHNADEDE